MKSTELICDRLYCEDQEIIIVSVPAGKFICSGCGKNPYYTDDSNLLTEPIKAYPINR